MGRGDRELAGTLTPARGGNELIGLCPPGEGADFQAFTEEKLNVVFLQDDAAVRHAAKEVKKLDPSMVAVDFETASKNGRFGSFNGSLRLIQLGLDEPERGIEPVQFVIDCHNANPKPFLPLLRSRAVEKPIHYMDFEQEWSLLHLGTSIGNIWDTCICFQVIQKKLRSVHDEAGRKAAEKIEPGFSPRSGSPAAMEAYEAAGLEAARNLLPGWSPHNNKLATLLHLYEGMEMPKENQASDWGNPNLRADQLVYAAMDVAALLPFARRSRAIAEQVGVREDVDQRIAWVKQKIGERVERAAARNHDDSERVCAALRRSRSLEEVEEIFRSCRQVTILAANRPKVLDAYKERKAQLLAG